MAVALGLVDILDDEQTCIVWLVSGPHAGQRLNPSWPPHFDERSSPDVHDIEGHLIVVVRFTPGDRDCTPISDVQLDKMEAAFDAAL